MTELFLPPADLREGDVLADEPEVSIIEVYADSDGYWIAFSDGAEGYFDRPLAILRDDE